MSETFLCSICGCETPLDERHIFDSRQLCDNCFEDETVICDCCENRVWRSDTVSDSHTIVCDSCYDRHYTTCTECGRILYYDAACYPDEDDEDAPYCRSCATQFASRTVSQMQQWAARYGRKDSPKEVMETAKNKCYSRYSCVNLLNYSTIEFRMFRGTLRYSTLKATLQLVNEICDVAFASSDEEMSDLTWVEFVARLDAQRCPELVNYLKERHLYVCEPVQGKEGFYIYASTKEILDQATTKLRLNRRHRKEIPLKQGEILKITPDGSRHVEQFQNDYLLQSTFNLYGWGGRYPYYPTYPTYPTHPSTTPDEEQPSYLEELMEFGESIGVMREDQQLLLDAGYTWMDLEEMFYDPMMLDVCLRDAACPV